MVALALLLVASMYSWRRVRASRRERVRRHQELLAAHPRIPLERALARRLLWGSEFEELRHFCGGYFNQDWNDDYDDVEEAMAAYLDDSSRADRTTLAQEIDRLLALGLSGGELLEALFVLGSYYLPRDSPGGASEWLRSVRERAL